MMQEENINGEQPQAQMTQTESTQLEEEKNIQIIETEVDNGGSGSLGKFKDAESLLAAYNNLQAEFTKKCQALAQLKKENETKQIDNNLSESKLPIYEREDWTDKVSAFLQENKQAQPFAKQIAEIILKDEAIAQSDSALDIAFAKVMSSSMVLPEKVVDDEKFVNDYVLKSEKVKKAVLEVYLKELEKNKTPNLLSGASSSQVLYKTKQASSLSEAKEIVKQMFN
jgi:hypothetical protein